RYVARDAVARRIAANPRFAAIDRAVGAEGRKIVFLLRLSPVFPFNLLNYGLGVTRVRFVDFFLASVGMLPGTVLYVYSGKLLGARVAITVAEEGDSAPAHDAGRVRQAELPLPARLDAEPDEDLARHHGVDRSGIDQELELLGDVGRGEVRDLHANAGEPHGA